MYVCECKHNRRRIISMGAWRGPDTRWQVVAFLNQFRRRLSIVRVDSIGVGYNFANHLSDCRFPVERVNVSINCESKPNPGESDPARRFVNLKACFYQAVADVFERDEVEGLVDDATIGQLTGILYEFDSQGRMKIESKEQARARGLRSPDRAEALMLALGKPPWTFEYYSERNPPGAERGPIGDRLSDDDDDYRPRGRSRWDVWAPGSLARYFARRRGTW